MKHPSAEDRIGAILAVSGGADSVYLLEISRKRFGKILVGHFNHGARGKASDADQRFVEGLCRDRGLALEVGTPRSGAPVSLRGGQKGRAPARFEERAREQRYAFLKGLGERHGAEKILVAHTADDQVETVLMRILEGAGISGLKGIPRTSGDGIERPLLGTWREDILGYLRRHGIRYRTDKSNFDTRFERNWVRHVLVPLLEKRYGKAVRKRILALGERFREIDDFLETAARRWMKRNVKPGPGAAGNTLLVPRKAYAKLPSAVRKKIVQLLCFDRMKIAPNERLLEAMDELIVSGKPSARLGIGKGASLSCRYGEAIFRSLEAEKASEASRAVLGELVAKEMAGTPVFARLRRLAAGERGAAFDAEAVSMPLSVRPLRAGDRIRPFGAAGEKKVKDVMIDRKIPRDERWGRAVVCDANGEIVWIPGIVRSSVAPVTRDTRRTVVLGISRPSAGMT